MTDPDSLLMIFGLLSAASAVGGALYLLLGSAGRHAKHAHSGSGGF
jgi:hypothetical protein